MNRLASFVLISLAIVSTPLQSQARAAQDLSENDRQRVEAFADEFIQAWNVLGDIRKISPKAFVPAFFSPSCEVTPLIQKTVCATLSVENRREYLLMLSNVLYAVTQHFLSEFKEEDEDALDNVEEKLFPPEVLDVLKTSDHPARNIDEFRELFSKLQTAERMLSEHRLKHRHETLPTYQKNMVKMSQRIEQEWPISVSRVDQDQTTLGLPLNTTIYSVVRMPFMFILTKGPTGEFQVAAMKPLDD